MISKRAYWLQAAQRLPALQQLFMAQCQRDILFWFRHFAWTFDPRMTQPHKPFVPYPYQEQTIQTLVNCIENGEDLLIEKSRDMGVSWLILLVFQYYWLFRDGANFHLGSRKQEAVDRKGDISTLFEKLRYNLDWLPDWMKPAGWQPSMHDNLLRLINPANGNVITGESSNENFGRGGRYRAALFDEFPFWPMQEAAYASAGQSTPCRIVVGTPYGKNNRFADLRFAGQIKTLSIHWNLHPRKDEAWYEAQKSRMSEDEIARELDINYHLSVKNRVFRNFTEANKRELLYSPENRVIRSWDFGYHCPACLFFQLDSDDCLLVLHEEVGKEDLLLDFAQRVQQVSAEYFQNAIFEDICDPAGAQRSDKSAKTSIEILHSLGIYPDYSRSAIQDGIELVRMKLSARINDKPGLMIDRRCVKLIEALEGGYRYTSEQSELPFQEHPHEDVVDCLRYAVMAKCGVLIRNTRSPKRRQPQNRYTGY